MDIGKIEFGPLTKDHLAGVADASSKIAQSLIAELDAAQRELAAYKQSLMEGIAAKWGAEDVGQRLAELLAANAGIERQPQP